MVAASARRDFEAGLLGQIDAVYNFARWAVGHPGEAETVTVDVVLRALRNATRCRGGMRAWLLDQVRNAARRQVQSDSVKAMGGTSHTNTFVDLLVPSRTMTSIGARAAGMELRAAEVESLRRAMAALPIEQREVILLRDTEELSYKEVAAILNVPRENMMLRLWRARDALAVSLRRSVDVSSEHEGAQALIDSYIDAEVDIATAATFVEHIAHCRRCAVRLLDRSRLVQQIHNVTVCCAPERLRNLIKAYWSIETRNRPL